MSSSFLIKTRSQQALARGSLDKRAAMKNYSKQFAVCARVALDSYNPSLYTFQRWADVCSEEFVNTVNRFVKHADVANELVEYFEENYSGPASVASPSPSPRATRYFTESGEVRAARYSALAVAENQEEEVSQAEMCLGNNAFNRFLFKEYETWYAAFDAEADEDPDGPDADERWTLQAAKKLQKRTGLSLANLTPVVGAWLLKHHDSF